MLRKQKHITAVVTETFSIFSLYKPNRATLPIITRYYVSLHFTLVHYTFP